MQTDYLKYLLALSETGSIAGAAEKSFITPQGVRRAIGALEREIGRPLIEREGRSAKLTGYGQAILDSARAMLKTQAKMQQIIKNVDDSESVELSYMIEGYFHSLVFDTNFFIPAINSISGLIRSIHMTSCSIGDVIHHMIKAPTELSDTTPIGIVILFSALEDKSANIVAELERHGYMVFPYMTMCEDILVSKDSPLAAKEYLTLDDVRNIPFALPNDDVMDTVKAVINPSYCTTVPDSTFRNKLIADGEAICTSPSITRLDPTSSSVVHMPFLDGWDVTVAFVGRTNFLEHKLVRRIIEALNEYYGSQPEEIKRLYKMYLLT